MTRKLTKKSDPQLWALLNEPDPVSWMAARDLLLERGEDVKELEEKIQVLQLLVQLRDQSFIPPSITIMEKTVYIQVERTYRLSIMAKRKYSKNLRKQKVQYILMDTIQKWNKYVIRNVVNELHKRLKNLIEGRPRFAYRS
jgi:hypothetical protein